MIEWFGVVKDAVLATSGGIGAYVALRGLGTWNRQLKGSAEYDLTRRILKCTYRLREAIKGVRIPFMWSAEMPSPPEQERVLMNQEQLRYYGTSRAYQARWNKVVDIRSELQTEILEAEALWGRDIHDLFEPLFKLQQELFADIHSYMVVLNPEELEGSRKAMAKLRQERREVLYDLAAAEQGKDEYSTDIAQAISAIEVYLRPHLKK